MKVVILGIDGYLGWTLAQYLTERGHEVGGIDAFLRRDWVAEMGSQSATPIVRMTDRLEAFVEKYGKEVHFARGNLVDYNFVWNFFRAFQPEAIVHLAEMPSAPYSMIDVGHAVETHVNNLTGTLNVLHGMRDVCPDAHLIKLGTMGEYGTPNLDIPEGFFEIAYRGRTDVLPFPRQPGSWYHCTKVHDSVNVKLACDLWGLRSTDIMQGVVYGVNMLSAAERALFTRFDFDQAFGTAINRYCAQAIIGDPLTPYGKGHQRRGFLPLFDSMQCMTLAIENPPKVGEYRVFNQFEETYDLAELAFKVQKVGNRLGLNVQVLNVENPRRESEEHYYNPDHQHLLDLGYVPNHDMESVLKETLEVLFRYKSRIAARRHALTPDIRWNGTRRRVKVLEDHHAGS